MTKDWTKDIEYILKKFDFTRVQKAMVALDWKWSGMGHSGFPSLEDLKETARVLLTRAISFKSSDSIATGGFEVTKWDDHLNLSFHVEEVNSLYMK